MEFGFKHTINIVLFSIAMFFSGCIDNNNPKDVSVYFVQALSEADLRDAKRLSSAHVKKKLDHLYNICSEYEIGIVTASVTEMFDALNQDKKFSATIRREIKYALDKDLRYTLKREYGHIVDMPRQKKEEKIVPRLEPIAAKIFEKFFTPGIDYGISILDMDDLIEKVFMKAYWQVVVYNLKGKKIYDLVNHLSSMYIINSAFDTPIECINKYTLFDKSIHNIGVLNIEKQKYGSIYTGGYKEETVVNLEVVKQDEKVVKMPISVEQIRKDWKVTKGNFIVRDNRSKAEK